MIDAITSVGPHSIVPLLAFASKAHSIPAAGRAKNLDSRSAAASTGFQNIFSALQGKIDDGFSFNPFRILLENSPYIQYAAEDDSKPNILAGLYLQIPNEKIKRLAMSIVSPTDSNDVKVAKIAAWVIDNVKYVEDKINYGTEELWAAPTMTLAKKSGDCEDGAFLIHSLALNAGVPADMLRTYGGLVKAGEGAVTGGHGWTAYRRESDNEWVVLDFSYYPAKIDTNARSMMKEDRNYIDDFFYMTLTEYVYTEATNRVRDPDSYDAMGRIKQSVWIGNLVDRFL